MESRASTSPILNLSTFLALSFLSVGFVRSSSCHPQTIPFLYDLQFQCPSSIASSLPIQMNGEALERALGSKPMDLYTAVLFYGSWCPFSSEIRTKFDTLSSMFPQVEHIEVEQSSAMPSLFSRYGVHSLPALLIINQTTKVHYHGRKDLRSLARFYHKVTGLNPSKDLSLDYLSGWVNAKNPNIIQLWNEASSMKEVIVKEPYLMLAIVFLILRVFLCFCPQILRGVAALWNACKRYLNLGVIGESGQFLGRVMHIVNVNGVWNKLKWSKTRNFHKGARSARVLASSLASVSLGEAS